MGLYINPTDMSKEEWLKENALLLETRAPVKAMIDPDLTLVCLVQNPFFSAAGIIYSEQELHAFSSPEDLRPKRWIWVETSKVVEVCPDYAAYLARG